MNPVAALVDFALAPHVLPAEVRADAERLLADTLAGGAAGAVIAAICRPLTRVCAGRFSLR